MVLFASSVCHRTHPHAQGICYMLAKTGAKTTCGWTWHRRTQDGTTAWSVFEDIMATSGQAFD